MKPLQRGDNKPGFCLDKENYPEDFCGVEDEIPNSKWAKTC